MANLTSVGRFSSQMLTQLGAQRLVQNVTGQYVNTYKYSNGNTTFIEPGALQQSNLGALVVGNFAPTTYDNTKSFFLSRGASTAYADTMAALAIDMASILQISVQQLLENAELTGQLLLTDVAYSAFNTLRDPGNQVGSIKSVSNRSSYKSREIVA
jgi:hypothetical protein